MTEVRVWVRCFHLPMILHLNFLLIVQHCFLQACPAVLPSFALKSEWVFHIIMFLHRFECKHWNASQFWPLRTPRYPWLWSMVSAVLLLLLLVWHSLFAWLNENDLELSLSLCSVCWWRIVTTDFCEDVTKGQAHWNAAHVSQMVIVFRTGEIAGSLILTV